MRRSQGSADVARIDRRPEAARKAGFLSELRAEADYERREMTTTIIYACGHGHAIETDKPMTKEQRQAEKEQRCPACRLHEPQNVFGYGGDVKAGGQQ